VPDVVSLPSIQGQCPYTAIAPTATDDCAGSLTATTTDPLTYANAGSYTINWNYNDGHGNVASQTQTLQISCTTGIDDLTTDNSNWSIHPNPANALAYLTYSGLAKESANLSITDLMGRTVKRMTIKDAMISLPLQDLADGLYFVTITSKEGKIAIKKLVVKH